MAKNRGRWNECRKAWDRLAGWRNGHPEDGEDALGALADIGMIRTMLEQTELVAVRAARRHGRSWAEIATQLGITRQSAWERWRDLDEAGQTDVASAVLDDVVADAFTQAEAEIVAVASARRRRSNVMVPNVVGMRWDDARDALRSTGLVAVGPEPDGLPLTVFGWPDSVVTDQAPEAGAKVPSGTAVTLYLRRGGGTGVREPRRPGPDPKPLRAMRAEPSEEAVG